jgi:uncharacterized protein
MRIAPGVEAYGGGGFRVAGVRYEGSILILDDVVRPWPVSNLADVTPQSLQTVFDAGLEAVEFILIGTGDRLAPAPKLVREAARAAAFGIEVMNTMEACRLYNLMAEDGRRVAAALIAV